MKKSITIAKITLTLAIFSLFLIFSCNPDCQSLQGVKVSTTTLPSGYELTVTANPNNSLKGKRVTFGGVEATTRFVDNYGLIVRVPQGISGGTQMQIEGSDCLDLYNYDFNVVNTDFFSSLANFSPPITPEIVIPEIPPFFPTFIDNAWLSPDFQNYCIWFTMMKTKKIVGQDTTIQETSVINPAGSFELSICCCKDDEIYASNPISGIIDKANNTAHIFIDRTSKGGDIEEFTGVFTDRSKSQYRDFTPTFDCNCSNGCAGSTNPVSVIPDKLPAFNEVNMLLFTSKKTGRQLAVYQKVSQ
jgi:hypothetical protein